MRTERKKFVARTKGTLKSVSDVSIPMRLKKLSFLEIEGDRDIVTPLRLPPSAVGRTVCVVETGEPSHGLLWTKGYCCAVHTPDGTSVDYFVENTESSLRKYSSCLTEHIVNVQLQNPLEKEK